MKEIKWEKPTKNVVSLGHPGPDRDWPSTPLVVGHVVDLKTGKFPVRVRVTELPDSAHIVGEVTIDNANLPEGLNVQDVVHFTKEDIHMRIFGE